MLLSDFEYRLPEELIAQEPLVERDKSRLMIVDRKNQAISHKSFCDILDYFNDDDLIVFNNSKVTAARLYGNKESGGKVEVLVINRISDGVWFGLVKPGRRIATGTKLLFDFGLKAVVIDRTNDGGRILKFEAETDPDELIRKFGQVPLPPYIHKRLEDPERYQTVYASNDGSAAAPTAGLHFTPNLLEKIKLRGIKTAYVTLHVGIGTFRPVRTEKIEDHEMHRESFEISKDCANKINSTKGRVICVGTTTARALESAAISKKKVAAQSSETELFMTPGYDFKIVDCLVTNFHIPKSTLLVLVSAFAGSELVRRAYAEAVESKYRFLSFGDAMFLY